MKTPDPLAKHARRLHVRQTGRIPPGTRVHHRHIRNLPTDAIEGYIEATRRLIAAGDHHTDWATKRLFALYDMLHAKRRVVEKRAASDRDRRRPCA